MHKDIIFIIGISLASLQKRRYFFAFSGVYYYQNIKYSFLINN